MFQVWGLGFDTFQVTGTPSQEQRAPGPQLGPLGNSFYPPPRAREGKCPLLTSEFDVALLIQENAETDTWESGSTRGWYCEGSGGTTGQWVFGLPTRGASPRSSDEWVVNRGCGSARQVCC